MKLVACESQGFAEMIRRLMAAFLVIMTTPTLVYARVVTLDCRGEMNLYVSSGAQTFPLQETVTLDFSSGRMKTSVSNTPFSEDGLDILVHVKPADAGGHAILGKISRTTGVGYVMFVDALNYSYLSQSMSFSPLLWISLQCALPRRMF